MNIPKLVPLDFDLVTFQAEPLWQLLRGDVFRMSTEFGNRGCDVRRVVARERCGRTRTISRGSLYVLARRVMGLDRRMALASMGIFNTWWKCAVDVFDKEDGMFGNRRGSFL